MCRWLQRLFSASGAAFARPASLTLSAPAPAPALPSSPFCPTVASERRAQPRPAAPVSVDQVERVNGLWNAWLFDCPAGCRDLDDAEARMLEALAAILAAQQSGAALVRRMPGQAPQWLHGLRAVPAAGPAPARAVPADALLAAAVIRLANHACREGGAAVASMEQAAQLVGPEGVRLLGAAAAFQLAADASAGFYVRRLAPRLWEHAERCALSARQVAAGMDVAPFDAFLAALLQNAGLIGSLRIMDQAARGDRRLGSAVFLEQLGRDTRRLCASIAREWQFPDRVAHALLEQAELRKGAATSPLGRLLKLADYLGKVRLLVEHGLLDEADASLFTGLAPQAAQCYSVLAASRAQVAAH